MALVDELLPAPGYIVGPPVERDVVNAPLPKPARGRIAPRNPLRHYLHDLFGWRFNEAGGVRMFDGNYYLPHRDEIDDILQQSDVARRNWVADRYDCDDFAFGLKAEFGLHGYDDLDADKKRGLTCPLAFGIIAGTFGWQGVAHMACFVVGAGAETYLIEPRLGADADPAEKFDLRPHDQCWECSFIAI